jgi:outer membrane murein-binding lipoprotein Lpp
MRSHWIAAALLGSVVMAGCGSRNTDTSQNSQQNQPTAAATEQAGTDQTVASAAASPASPSADTSTAREIEHPVRAPRSTTGRREPSPAAQTSRNATPATTYSNAAPSAPRENHVENTPPATPKLPEFKEVTIPAGTSLPLTMTSTISSASAQVEAPVSARLTNAVVIDGDTVIPAGSTVSGTVTDVERSGRVEGRAHIAFAFNQARINGEREDLKTNPLTFEADATKTKDAEKVGIGAVGGAILGGILGGKKGAGKGAIAGGAAGTGVVLATRGEEVTVNEGTNVTATLAQPLTVRIPIR